MENETKEKTGIPEHRLALAIDLFSQYAPTADLCGDDNRPLTQHVLEIRAKAYAVHEYPCIDMCAFLNATITGLWNYESEILPRVTAPSRAKLLDVGCCFGQIARRLVVDGADPKNLIGADLHPEFIQFGYELFRDGPNSAHPLTARFETGDIFNKNFLADLDGSVDIIHVASVLHLFPMKDQLTVANRFDELLDKQPGALIVGTQLGVENAGEVRRGGIFRHNSETFKEFWCSIGDGKWEVDVREQKLNIDLDKYAMKLAEKGDSILLLNFVVKRL
jgi:SAM-dependent methyltransferase